MSESNKDTHDLTEKLVEQSALRQASVITSFPEADSRFCDHRSFAGRFHQSLYRADRNDRQVMLLMVRVDGFYDEDHSTQLTDIDKLLKLTISRIGSCLRRGDTLASIGDGLFAILLEEIRDPSVVPLAIEKIHAALSHPFHIEKTFITVNYFTGASLFPIDGFLCSQLWTQAKIALDTASETGHGTFSLTPQMMGHNAIEGHKQSRELHQAAKSDQLQLVYQPIFDSSGERTIGIEALIRWHHPEHGLLKPGHFMPVLEETGLIIPVGERLAEDACRLASRLQREGHSSIKVTLNISARQFSDTGFLLSILDALYNSGLTPALLELEISEETLLKNIELSQRLLIELQGIGIKVIVDRFGAGNSSLTQIIGLPLSGLKIDSELVKGLPMDKRHCAVSAGIFTMAQGVGLKTAASGVENKAQLSALQEMNCEQMQGFYFTKPMSADALLHWLPN
jgi:EAL domain-containing protein (putative c-di-GMP-specific phosphodiesterase class I)/GGDEF domain-containing protein